MRPAQLTPENDHAGKDHFVGLHRFNEAGAINAGKLSSAKQGTTATFALQ